MGYHEVRRADGAQAEQPGLSIQRCMEDLRARIAAGIEVERLIVDCPSRTSARSQLDRLRRDPPRPLPPADALRSGRHARPAQRAPLVLALRRLKRRLDDPTALRVASTAAEWRLHIFAGAPVGMGITRR